MVILFDAALFLNAFHSSEFRVGIKSFAAPAPVIFLHHSGVIISFDAPDTGLTHPLFVDWYIVDPFGKYSL
jgi:hypothetical protein